MPVVRSRRQGKGHAVLVRKHARGRKNLCDTVVANFLWVCLRFVPHAFRTKARSPFLITTTCVDRVQMRLNTRVSLKRVTQARSKKGRLERYNWVKKLL